jgi:predicted aconitase with swiveling domain
LMPLKGGDAHVEGGRAMTTAERPAVKAMLHGRGLGGGACEGEALVTREAISGWGGVDPATGTVIESRHELCGRSFAGKVLVFPGAKGSSGWSGVFHQARLGGCGPAAMVFTVMNTKIALGVVVTHVPCVTDLDQDPFGVIRTGDWVRVDGDRGTVEVRQPPPES